MEVGKVNDGKVESCSRIKIGNGVLIRRTEVEVRVATGKDEVTG